MRSIPVAILGLAFLFAGCDTSTQAGTSSETQTALQELADNVRKAPGSGLLSGSVLASGAAARKAGDSDTQSAGGLTEASICLALQQEFFPPMPSQLQSALWMSFRIDPPQRMDGTPYHCGDGVPLRWYLQQVQKDSATLARLEYEGWYLRSGTQGFIDSAALLETIRYPSGFELISDLFLGGIDRFNIPHSWHSVTFFGNGRFRLLDSDTQPNWNGISHSYGSASGPYWSTGSNEHCTPISDLNRNVVIGAFCRHLDSSAAGWTESIVVRGPSGEVIVPRNLHASPVDDSMGLRLEDSSSDRQACPGAPIHLRIHAKTVRADSLIIGARTWLAVQLASTAPELDSTALVEDSVGNGMWVPISVTPTGASPDTIVVGLERRYWNSQTSSISEIRIPLGACRQQ
jgi:hypothetical protein